jgi:signal transduction histidine kinase
LYGTLQELFGILVEAAGSRSDAVEQFVSRNDADELVTRIQRLGLASYQARPSPLMAKTLHDVRGGGLSALLSRMQLVGLGVIDTDAMNALYFLTRDHLKIMRNALLGLDDAKRAEDLLPKIHGTDFIVEKWNGAHLGGRERELRLDVECPQPVAISECCVEFGALDRILYNLINNACRHTDGEALRLVLFPVPTLEGENLRFVLLNPIPSTDAARLGEIDLRTLFQAGVSTTGSGLRPLGRRRFCGKRLWLKQPDSRS